MKDNLYVTKAANGDWLLLQDGSPDKLLAIRRTRFAIRIAKRQFKQTGYVRL